MALAALLPVTSKEGSTRATKTVILARIRAVADSLPDGSRIYLGIDNDDTVLQPIDQEELEQATHPHGVTQRSFAPTNPSNIIGIVNELCMLAFADGMDFFALLGDDVSLQLGWFESVKLKFTEMERSTGQPGFGCVALDDVSFPGFPTFPVVGRPHVEIFGGWAPSAFINQGADPWIFEVYRKFNSACFCDARVRNGIGGDEMNAPRYVKHTIPWKDDILFNAVASVRTAKPFLKETITLDVLVPSFRADLDTLQRICELDVPSGCSTQVVIVIDDPTKKDVRQLLEKKYGHRVRVRANDGNLGASASRNRALDESAAEWVLFLDDDVHPDNLILHSYVDAIRAHGDYVSGFVGPTQMPPPSNVYCAGIELVWLLYFWSKHVRSRKNDEVPWGVTAQLCTRRIEVRFELCFPKTGGGEDIDYCLRVKHVTKKPLLGIESNCVHPWWDKGYPQNKRFYGWAKGDSMLIPMHPKHAYFSFPNAIESMAITCLASVAWMCFNSTSYTVTTVRCMVVCFGILLCDAVCDVSNIFREDHVSNFRGTRRLLAGLIGSVWYKNLATEIGHLYAPICRFQFQMFRRFDWWCGTDKSKVDETRLRELRRFVVFACFAWFVASSW